MVEGMTRTLLRRDITNITLFADAQGKGRGLCFWVRQAVGMGGCMQDPGSTSVGPGRWP